MGMENFKITVIRNSLIKIIGIICIFLFVKSDSDLWLYTICVTAPLLIGNVSLWFVIKKYLTKSSLHLSELAKGIKRRFRPIIILFLPQIATNVYTVLDKTMIGLFSSSIDQVGYYSQAQNIVRVVLAIVTSLGTVMLPAMSASFAKGDHERIVKSIKTSFTFVYMLSFALLFGLCAVASRFVPIFFGDGYEPVVPLMVIISPIIVIIATSNVVGRQFLIPTNQQKFFTISIISGACTNIVLNIILIHFFDAVGATIASVLAESVVTGVQCWCVRKQLPLIQCLKSSLKYLTFGAIMFLTVRGVGKLLPDGIIWGLVVMVFVGVIVYVAELLITKDSMVEMGIGLAKNWKK